MRAFFIGCLTVCAMNISAASMPLGNSDENVARIISQPPTPTNTESEGGGVSSSVGTLNSEEKSDSEGGQEARNRLLVDVQHSNSDNEESIEKKKELSSTAKSDLSVESPDLALQTASLEEIGLSETSSKLEPSEEGNLRHAYKLVTKTGLKLDGNYSFLPRREEGPYAYAITPNHLLGPLKQDPYTLTNRSIIVLASMASYLVPSQKDTLSPYVEKNTPPLSDVQVLNVNHAFFLLSQDKDVSVLPKGSVWSGHEIFVAYSVYNSEYYQFHNPRSNTFLAIVREESSRGKNVLRALSCLKKGDNCRENTYFRLIPFISSEKEDSGKTNSPHSGLDTRIYATQLNEETN